MSCKRRSPRPMRHHTTSPAVLDRLAGPALTGCGGRLQVSGHAKRKTCLAQRVSCETLGWWVRSVPYRGDLSKVLVLALRRAGCRLNWDFSQRMLGWDLYFWWLVAKS
jgi:hypothetical protein